MTCVSFIGRYAVPSLQWLGVRSSMLADAADDAWQPLTQRDTALIATLRSGPLQVSLCLECCSGWSSSARPTLP